MKVKLLKVNCDVILVAEEDDGTLIELPPRQAVLSLKDLDMLRQVVEGEIERINAELAEQQRVQPPVVEAPVVSESPVVQQGE